MRRVGGTGIARDLILEAIARGKHVVTANKALLAERGREVFSAAEQHGVDVYYEAAVCGGSLAKLAGDWALMSQYEVGEISEAPRSFHKTLRGRVADTPQGLRADLGDMTFPADVAQRLVSGAISKVRIIGQGTAFVAGSSMAAVLDDLCGGALDVDAITATELSGFHLRLDMSDTLVVAVSQSGTTTDTNRTVDLARSRGAAVVAIVNRRNSDLTDKADGVLYTSDGRDVEMSVASTKAFYAQVAAAALLACAISEAAGLGTAARRTALLASLRELPDAMEAVVARRDAIADVARRSAPPKRYWALVGNGPNHVAAAELRIKLSELCYKSIACDITEDKKHIDLSAEPLIFVCAAGLNGSTADDVAKELAIYRAHKAAPIVVADDGSGQETAEVVAARIRDMMAYSDGAAS